MRDRRGERGEGRLSSIIWLIVIILLFYAGFNVGRVYIAHYALADKVNVIARTPSAKSDEFVMDLLMKYVEEERLDGWIQRSDFTISSRESSRRITCSYDREVKVLPGFVRVFHFTIDVDQPLVF